MLRACEERANSSAADCEVFTFVDQRGNVTESLTNADLWRQSEVMAAALLKELQRGDRVLLVYTPGLDFVVAFLACLRAELVAVPISPPDLTQNGAKAQEESRKFIAIANDSGAAAVLTNREYNRAKIMNVSMNWIKSWVMTDCQNMTWPDLPWIITNDLLFGSETLSPQTTETPLDRVAFLILFGTYR